MKVREKKNYVLNEFMNVNVFIKVNLGLVRPFLVFLTFK